MTRFSESFYQHALLQEDDYLYSTPGVFSDNLNGTHTKLICIKYTGTIRFYLFIKWLQH